MESALRQSIVRLSCGFWGHVVYNEVFRRADTRRCRCGTAYLAEDGTSTRVRRTLSCFLRHHTYVRLTDRDGMHEYVCVQCGHLLVYPVAADPFADREWFGKRVHYQCGFFGHRVRAVAARDGFTEYACHCGHSFLKTERAATLIRHPMICFFTAHRIRFVSRRCGFAEYVCADCGHPFCFAHQTAS